MASEQRSRLARDRAEAALIRFALLAGEHASDFVVIGGLNPDFLAPNAPLPHIGTTDVDLVFELGFVYDRENLDFSWLDGVLQSGGFTMHNPKTGWRWRGRLGDTPVVLDLLCDVPDNRGQVIDLPESEQAAVQNLIGPAAALINPIERELAVPDVVRLELPESPTHVRLRFASLGGYIAAKSSALLARELAKDAYDLAFVLMYAPGGPRAAASAVASVELPPYQEPIAPVVKAAMMRLTDTYSPWVAGVVRQLHAAGDESDTAQLETDVCLAAQQFLDSYDP